MVRDFSIFILIFFTYSFIGYLLEIISVSRIKKKIDLSRGYLIGPYLPIFGIGSILIIINLNPYKNDIFVLYIMSIVLCCILEYLVSFVLEKVFGMRWWDYSNKKYNINGRVCLENGVLFGLCGIIIVKYFNPFLLKIILSLPNFLIITLGLIIFSIMFIDFVWSTYIIWKLKEDSTMYSEKDSTNRIKNEIIKSLEKYHFFHKRLFKAFPKIKDNKRLLKIKDVVDSYRKERR